MRVVRLHCVDTSRALALISPSFSASAIWHSSSRAEPDAISMKRAKSGSVVRAESSAMLLAIDGLDPAADYLLIDALQLKQCPLPQKAIIKGDSISASIAAASVIAKTHRDGLMKAFDSEFPEYGFAGHKGYGATSHLAALREHGPCRLHRRSFRGVL